MSKRKLLLADDSITIQKVVNLTFADEGIDVITVGDGNAAMAKISEAAPDVILADVHMPGLSGYEVCEMVRQNEATKGLPVVLLVGSFEPFDENEAARVGANAFLTKPFQSIRQLVSQVSDLMQASAPVGGSVAEPAVETFAPVETVSDHAPESANQYSAPSEAADVTGTQKVPDTTDIDSLYRQSVGGGPSESDAETGPPTYVDAGMDDEMIETVHAAAESEEAEPAEDFYQEPTAEYHQPTDQYQMEPVGYDQQVGGYEQSVVDHQPAVDEYREPSAQYAQQPVADHQTAFEEYREPSSQFVDQQADQQPAFDEYREPTAEYQELPVQYEQTAPDQQPAIDEYREPAVENQEPAAQYEQPAEDFFQEESPRSPSPFDSPAEEIPASEPHAFHPTNPLDEYSSTHNIPNAAPTGEFSLDEADLLELPPMHGGEGIEVKTGPDGGKQVVSLSPELMDALVEKVVSKLSKKE